MAQYHLLPRTDASVSMFLASILSLFFFGHTTRHMGS